MSSTRSVASAGGDRGHSAGKFLWSLHSSRALFLRTISKICISHAAWASGEPSLTKHLRVQELSAPRKLLALGSISPLTHICLKARQDRGFPKKSAGLDHPESSKGHCQLLSVLPQSVVSLPLLSFASLSCCSKVVIFSGCNNTPGLKSPILRDLLPLTWKPLTTSYKGPQSFWFSVLLGQLWHNSMRW